MAGRLLQAAAASLRGFKLLALFVPWKFLVPSLAATLSRALLWLRWSRARLQWHRPQTEPSREEEGCLLFDQYATCSGLHLHIASAMALRLRHTENSLRRRITREKTRRRHRNSRSSSRSPDDDHDFGSALFT